MTELKPCPFCGGEVFLQALYGGNYVECGICKCSTERFIKMEDAIQAWNTRPNPWHTGTPSEEGWYLIAIRFGNRIEYESRKCKRIIDNNGNECMRFDGCNPVLAWQKITPYEEN